MKLKSSNKIIAPLAAAEKMRNWCAYQERSQNEARQKLYEFRLEPEITESIIIELINENYLNDERFAMAFASGKFRIKQWGKIKIKMGLRQHKISDYCIKKALESIGDTDYEKALVKVIEKKLNHTKGGDQRKNFYTVSNHAISRGFESELVIEQLKLLLGNIEETE
jgi:regulatory protein